MKRSFLWLALALLCPLPIQAVGLLIFVLIALGKTKYDTYYFLPAYGLTGLSLIVAGIYQNGMGLLNSLGLLAVLIILMVLRSWSIDMDKAMDWFIVTSLIFVVWGLFEFHHYSAIKGYSFFAFHVQNSPRFRISTAFYNANIYATYLELILAACAYRFFSRPRLWLIPIAILNVLMVYLTGCRAAFIPLALVLVVMLAFSNYRKILWGLIPLGMLGGYIVLSHPHLSSRLSDFSTIESRFKIWKTALKMIKDHWLFGGGFQAYGHWVQSYHGHRAPHAHNLYLDLILSTGLVGLSLIVWQMRRLWSDWKNWFKENKLYFALILSILCIILVHGLVDVTFNYPTTAIMAGALLTRPIQKSIRKE